LSRESKKDWKKRNLDKVRARKIREGRESRRHALSSHRLWSQKDDNKILADDRPMDRELGKKIGRSVHAIQDRRMLLRNGGAPSGGVKKAARSAKPISSPEAPRTVAKPPKPSSQIKARLQALSMGFSPPANASVDTIERLIERYKPFHDAGVVVGMKVEMGSLGDCKITEIHPGSLRVTVLLLGTASKRFVAVQDVKRALAMQRRNRRGVG
jgi:hypothetical protein